MELKDLILCILTTLSLAISILVLIFSFIEGKNRRFEITKEYTIDVLKWHSRAVELFVRIKANNVLKDDERKEIVCELQALYLIGKYFFPNIDKGDGFGQEKFVYNQNYRNVILDIVLIFAEMFKDKGHNQDNDTIDSLLHRFNDEVFKYIDPYEYRKLALGEKKLQQIEQHSIEDIFRDIEEKYPEIIKYVEIITK